MPISSEFFTDNNIVKRAHKSDFSNDEKVIIAEIHKQIFNKNLLSSCPKKYKEAYFAIQNSILNKNNKNMKNKEQKYQLKRGVSINYKGIIYTSINITDSVAENYLKEYPEKKIKFSEIPETHKESKKNDVLSNDIIELKFEIEKLQNEISEKDIIISDMEEYVEKLNKKLISKKYSEDTEILKTEPEDTEILKTEPEATEKKNEEDRENLEMNNTENE